MERKDLGKPCFYFVIQTQMSSVNTRQTMEIGDMYSWYSVIMNSNKNPLNKLPPAQRFQIMVFLSLMWTTIFTTGASLWMWYGELLTGHLLVALGIALTGSTFQLADNKQVHEEVKSTDFSST